MVHTSRSAKAVILAVAAIGYAGFCGAQESSAFCPASSDCKAPSQLAAGDTAIDSSNTESFDQSGDSLSGVLVTPEVLGKMHRNVQLIVPDKL